VGKSSFSQCKKILTPKGIYISTEFGAYGANVWHTLLTPLLGGKRVFFPLPTINKADVLLLKSLVEAGTFKPLIDRKYPLAQIVAAYQYVETHQKTGNVLITMV
jgi:NADPH:quinone reductase-like Zn-dependent oxidoreductase